MSLKLTILGCHSASPRVKTHPTSQFLQIKNHNFLIDCGEGTQHQMHQFRQPADRIQQIFISHLHGDHVFGLMGLLTSYCLKKRTKKLEVFSPPGLWELIEHTARLTGVKFPYEIDFFEVDANISERVFENDHLEVLSIPLNHRTACAGWLFCEKEKPRNILKEKIHEYDIPVSKIVDIKNGEDLILPDKRIIPNSELTTAPNPPRRFAFCSDTAPSKAVAKAVQGADLLYHEATFSNEHIEEARMSNHSTAEQAATIAKQARVNICNSTRDHQPIQTFNQVI